MKSSIRKSRRDVLRSAATAVSAVALAPMNRLATAQGRAGGKIKLGFDNFSIRGMNWKAPRLLDYAASLKVDTVLFSDLDVYDSHDAAYLQRVKAQADRLGLELHVGTGGVCPTSSRFNDKWGSAEEHLTLTVRIAKALGSPVARCYLGSSAERRGDGGIFRHIDSTVKVCKAVRNRAVDAGVRIAIENHAGDMQAWELVELIKAAGEDYVGATMDSGNAVWALEDPLVNLEILGPYAASTGLRDSAIWATDRGANVQWTDLGDGQVDFKAYVKRFVELCPGVPFILEIISGGPREFPYLDPEFWSAFPKARAHEFARFVAMAKRGRPPTSPPDRPTGPRSRELAGRQQRYDLERSVKYSKEVLGLGRK